MSPWPISSHLRLHRLFHDARIEAADLGVERHRAADAVLGQHLHDPPHADPIAVVAARMVADVRRLIADLDMEVLDIGDHPHRNPRAVRPDYARPVDDGLIGKKWKRAWILHANTLLIVVIASQ